jgi:cytochrome c2
MRSPRGSVFISLAVIAIVGGTAAAAANYLKERHKKTEHAIAMTRGNPDRAMQAIVQYGCAACHNVPDVQMPGGLAAVPLSGVADRLYVGGVLENTPDNLVRWIVNPKQFNPKSAMPVTGISEAEARNVAAYLYQGR